MKYSKPEHDEANQLFTIKINEQVARVEYRMKNGVMQLIHSEVPPSLRGQGIGNHLVKKVFEYIETHNLKVLAVCSFIAAVAHKKDRWKGSIL